MYELLKFISILLLVIIIGNPNMESVSGMYVISVFVIWIPVIVKNFIKSSDLRRLTLLSLLFMCVMGMYKLFGISSSPYSALSGYFYWLFVMLIGINAVKGFSDTKKKILFWFLIFSIFVNLLFFLRNGLVISLLGYVDDAAEMASTSYGTSLMLFMTVCTFCFYRTSKVIEKFIYGFIVILCILAIFVVLQKATNVILCFASLFVMHFFRNLDSIKKSIGYVSIFFCIIMGLYFSGILSGVLYLLSENIDGRLSSRLETFAILIETGSTIEAGSSVEQRAILMNNSWNTFLNNILFGVGDHRINNDIIGNHSNILDTMARYGLIGLTLLWFIIKNQYSILIKFNKCRNDKQVTTFLLIFFGLYLFRNYYGAAFSGFVSCIMFIQIPLALFYYKKI